MSANYYRKPKPVLPTNSYGFKQVTAKELTEILNRVTRSTYSAKIHTEEQRQVNNYDRVLEESGRRSVLSVCSRDSLSRVSSANSSNHNNKRLTEREMSRLIRRLQRPTTATAAQRFPNEEMDNLKQGKIVRARSADVHTTNKLLAKLRRPTTATLAKTLNTCHLCYDHENKKNKAKPQELDVFDYDYGEKKVVPAEEVDFIVGRVSQPTSASHKGRHSCRRLPEYIDEVKIREDLPLLSGLSRSKTVDEITNRLYPARPKHGHFPQATQITSY